MFEGCLKEKNEKRGESENKANKERIKEMCVAQRVLLKHSRIKAQYNKELDGREVN